MANLADEITYYSHDLDDGIDAELLTEDELRKSVRLWHDGDAKVRAEHGELADECRRYFIIRCLIDSLVSDVVETSGRLITDSGVQSANQVRLRENPLIQYSEKRRETNLELREYLYDNLYYNPVVHEPNLRALKLLEELFAFYLDNPNEIGSQSRARMEEEGPHRAICDYLAGMTDRYVVLEHKRLKL